MGHAREGFTSDRTIIQWQEMPVASFVKNGHLGQARVRAIQRSLAQSLLSLRWPILYLNKCRDPQVLGERYTRRRASDPR